MCVQVRAKEHEARSALKESEERCEEHSRQVSMHKTEVSDVSLSLEMFSAYVSSLCFRLVVSLCIHRSCAVACYKVIQTLYFVVVCLVSSCCPDEYSHLSCPLCGKESSKCMCQEN